MTSKPLHKLFCLAVLLLGTQPIYAQTQNNQEKQTMEHDQIHATINTNNAAVFAGYIDGIRATFEPNGVLIGQPGMPPWELRRYAPLLNTSSQSNPKLPSPTMMLFKPGILRFIHLLGQCQEKHKTAYRSRSVDFQ
jgi:hypothetical protein